jgi:alkylation response protein AidB-like acyl-CoA dehydrogenase
VSTRAVLDNGEWVVDGQKVWTSWAQESDWIFVIARTEPGSSRHHGLSFLLMPLDQEGVDIRPIKQITGDSEFNEVFFSGARTDQSMIVGEPGDGWKVAMALLGFERGVSVLGQQVGFERELNDLIELARSNGSLDDPVLRDRLAQHSAEFEVMRVNAIRSLTEATPGADNVAKLVWANWHRRLGELAMEISGAGSLTTAGESYDIDRWQSLFLFSRADTLYGGSDEVQRNIIAERVLGLPREARG